MPDQYSNPAEVINNELQYGYEQKYYLSETCTNDASGLYKPNMLGGVLEYDVDLSSVTLGAAAHLVILDFTELSDLVKRLLSASNKGTANCFTLNKDVEIIK